MTDRAGIVLAGGHSRRFGDQDKALACVDGAPLIRRVVDRLRPVVGQVYVSCRADQQSAFEDVLGETAAVEYVLDPKTAGGPLVGVQTALEAVEARTVAVVACDMPDIDSEFLNVLFDACAGYEGVVPTHEDGTPEPLCAVYRTDPLREACERQLQTDIRSLQATIERLELRLLSPGQVATHTDWSTFQNINTRADLRAFQGRGADSTE